VATLADIATPSLAAGALQNFSPTVTIPSSATAGTYYIWVVADIFDVVSQSDTNNDFLVSSALTVTGGGGGGGTGTPDLMPQSVSLSTTSVAAGGTLTVSFTILNQGTGAAPATTTRLRLGGATSNINDPTLVDIPTPALAAGATQPFSQAVTIPSTTTAGTYYIWVVADALFQLGQSHYVTRSAALTVGGGGGGGGTALPDLIPQNLSLSTSSVAAGGTLTVSFTIKNQSTGTAGATTTRLRLGTSATTSSSSNTVATLADIATPSLAAGASQNFSQTVTIPSSTTAGTYYIWVVADYFDVVSQSDANNDFLVSSALTVTGGGGGGGTGTPDLMPQSPSLSTTSVAAGGTLTVSFTITNQGTGAAPATTTRLRLGAATSNINDPTLLDIATPALAAGATQTFSQAVTIPSTTTAGTYYIWVVADALFQLGSSHYITRSPALTVTGGGGGGGGTALPDLIPQNLSLSASSVAAGGTLTVSFTIKNQGTATAAATTTRLRLGTSASTSSSSNTVATLADIATPSLAAGATQTFSQAVTIPSSTAAGTYYIWAVSDILSAITQTDANNDFLVSSALTVTGGGGGGGGATLPDLIPQNLSLSPSSVAAGGTLTVSFTIKNQGTATAAATTTRLRLGTSGTSSSSSNTVATLADIATPSLAAGATQSFSQAVTIPSSTAPGTYYVWIVGDIFSAITQSDPNNDFVVSSALTVTASVTGGQISTAGVTNGASFLAGFTPGSIVTIFGVGITKNVSGILLASSLPLPTSLGGTSVSISGIQAPLFAVANVGGREQINLQVPYEITGQTTVSIQVNANGVLSNTVQVSVMQAHPGIFTVDGAVGAILHGIGNAPVTASNPALPNEVILIYATGLGPVSPAPRTGYGAPGAEPLARTMITPTVTIRGVNAPVQFSGLAPNYVGLYQVNVAIPAGTAAGSVPVIISSGGTASNTAYVTVGQANPNQR
jgi:uncharacterized protein (TIGR03437 family)